MKLLKTVNLIFVILLGLSSGISKIMQIPQEMDFFQGQMGYSANTIILFGAAQLAAGILIVFAKTRATGAILLAATFSISTLIVFMAGKIGFGFFSILPVAMAGIVIREAIGKAPATDTARAAEL